MSVAGALMKVGSEIVHVVVGSSCVVCEADLPIRRRVASCCVDCWRNLPRIEEERCGRCALPMPGVERGAVASCLRCISEPLATSRIDSWGRYDSGLTKVLHAFKFQGHAFLADPLADLLATVVFDRNSVRPDVIVAVPMTRARERRRGYNQAGLLARCLAQKTGLRCEERFVRKVTESRTQSELKKSERRANVLGSFAADARVSGLAVLVVDDICTTGETLSACAEALLAAGATDVAALTVARTP